MAIDPLRMIIWTLLAGATWVVGVMGMVVWLGGDPPLPCRQIRFLDTGAYAWVCPSKDGLLVEAPQ